MAHRVEKKRQATDNRIKRRTVFDLSKKTVGRRSSAEGLGPGEGHQKISDCFHFKIVHSGAFSYTNCKVFIYNQTQRKVRYSRELTVIQA